MEEGRREVTVTHHVYKDTVVLEPRQLTPRSPCHLPYHLVGDSSVTWANISSCQLVDSLTDVLIGHGGV